MQLAETHHLGEPLDIPAYWVSEKYDGVRAWWDGQQLLSRSGHRLSAPAWFTACLPRDATLDGELWTRRGDFENLSGIVRRSIPDDADWRQIHYRVFDLPLAPGRFEQRHQRRGRGKRSVHLLRVRVTDSGIGMSEAGLQHLFTPFSQVDSGLARQFEGTGLGLAMVKLLTDLHGGVVAVESAVGEGSCFTVWIPIRTQDEPGLAEGETVGDHVGVPGGSRTALVVESNYRSAELIRVQLEAEGFAVLHARSAEEALLIAESEALSLITLDIMMPDVDGWLFLEHLKGVPRLRLVPVVIVSILADRSRGIAMGAAAVMESPVSRQELYDTLVVLGLSPLAGDQMIRVLVVDDDPKSVELIAIRVRGMASEVFRAFGGQEAIDIARRELPDLIILDLMMPGVSGFDVVDALNERPETASIPVVVVTAAAVSDEERTRLNGSVTSVIGKAGFDGDKFIAEVRRAIAGNVAAA